MSTLSEQLEATRSLRENWDGYGAAAPKENVLALAHEFVALIQVLLRAFQLHVSPTRVGGVLIDWEDGSRQHEIEINPDRSISFLHLNKATGQIETRKFTPGTQEVVDPGFLQELRHLLAA